MGGPHVGGGDLRDLHHDDYQGVVGSGYSRSDFADALAAVDAAWAGFERGYIMKEREFTYAFVDAQSSQDVQLEEL